MSAVAVPSARRIAWQRRRRALAGAWAQYRHSRPGMVGLGILALFVLLALSAPLLEEEAGLRAVNVTDNPVWASPGDFAPLGTDKFGRSIWTQLVWGSRISLLVGLAATVIASAIMSASRRRNRRRSNHP